MKTHARHLAVALLLLLTLTLPTPQAVMAATATVTDCGDSGGAGQLRAQIGVAAPGDRINIVACTITLTTIANPLIINKTLTITGQTEQNTLIAGGAGWKDRIFEINGGNSLTVKFQNLSSVMRSLP